MDFTRTYHKGGGVLDIWGENKKRGRFREENIHRTQPSVYKVKLSQTLDCGDECLTHDYQCTCVWLCVKCAVICELNLGWFSDHPYEIYNRKWTAWTRKNTELYLLISQRNREKVRNSICSSPSTTRRNIELHLLISQRDREKVWNYLLSPSATGRKYGTAFNHLPARQGESTRTLCLFILASHSALDGPWPGAALLPSLLALRPSPCWHIWLSVHARHICTELKPPAWNNNT